LHEFGLTLIDRIQDLELADKPVATVSNRVRLDVKGSENELGLQLMADRAATYQASLAD
jgi:hypothetical protein